MGESDLQAIGGNNFKKYVKKVLHGIKENPIDEQLKNAIQSVKKSGKVHDALGACIIDYNSDFFDSECINSLIDIITQKGKEVLKDNAKLTLNHLKCAVCNQFMKDPVTLKCGHTFSKKCILSKTKDDAIVCEKCQRLHRRAYIEQLKNNVTILALVDTVCKPKCSRNTKDEENVYTDKDCGLDVDANEKVQVFESDADLALLLESVSSQEYSMKGDQLASLGKLEDAFRAYLTSYTLDSSMAQAKEMLNKLLQQLLAKYCCRVCSKIRFDDLSLLTVNLRKKSITGSDESLFSADSNDSFVGTDECYSSSSDENDNLSKDWNEAHWKACEDVDKLHVIVQVFLNDIEKITDLNSITALFDPSSFHKQDFECPLCIRIFWEPVTTPCGHTFCRFCLNRSLDHQIYCPMCKTPLDNESYFLAQGIQNINEIIDLAIKTVFPNEYSERRAIYEEEMKALLNAGKGPEHEIPLFICTIAYPTVPCPLHIYEPRYRLMIRQCMESGTKQFGMCAYIDDNIAEFGTLLEIRHIQYFLDGRSVVDARGSKRFRILKKGERDGYHTAAVEFLKDETYVDVDTEGIMENHDRVYKICQSWFMRLPTSTKCQIIDHFGPMPQVEADYINNPNGPSWLWWIIAVLPLEPRLQLLLLSMTSLPRRLNTLNKILVQLQSNMIV